MSDKQQCWWRRLLPSPSVESFHWKRLYFAVVCREWPWRVPKGVARIGFKRPPESVFREFRRLHGLDDLK